MGFPASWRMTAERRAELGAKRAEQVAAPVNESARVEAPADGAQADVPSEHGATTSNVISGLDAIEAARQIELQRAEEPIMVEAKKAMPKGKQGRKEMGQRPTGRR